MYGAQEQYPKALEHLQQALQIYRVRGDRDNQGKVLQDLSYVCKTDGSMWIVESYLRIILINATSNALPRLLAL